MNTGKIVNELHNEFMEEMNKKYKGQWSEKDIEEIFNTPKTFLNWCLIQDKIQIKING